MPEPDVPLPHVIWRENQAAFNVFCRVAEHGQWVRNPADANQILSIDGGYLIAYLRATRDGDISALIDEVYLVVRGWLEGRAEAAEP